MGTIAAVEAFGREHRDCADVSVHVTEPGAYGYAVSIRCACGARMLRWVEVEEALSGSKPGR